MQEKRMRSRILYVSVHAAAKCSTWNIQPCAAHPNVPRGTFLRARHIKQIKKTKFPRLQKKTCRNNAGTQNL